MWYKTKQKTTTKQKTEIKGPCIRVGIGKTYKFEPIDTNVKAKYRCA